MSHYYVYGGWRVQSDIPLAYVDAWEGDRTNADLSFSFSWQSDFVARKKISPFIAIGEDGAVHVEIPGVAKFLAKNSGIDIFPSLERNDNNTAVFLQGTVMPLVCYLRGCLPFQASAIEMEGKTMVFVGAAGTGKSTVAALLADQGGVPLCDDLGIVNVDVTGEVTLRPVGRILKLWHDTVVLLELQNETRHRNRDGQDKFIYTPISERRLSGQSKIDRIYVLDKYSSNDSAIINGMDSSISRRYLKNNLHFSRLFKGGGLEEAIEGKLNILSKSIPVEKLSIPFGFASTQARIDFIEELLSR